MKSKDFFKQSALELVNKRRLLIKYLESQEYSQEKINIYLEAYNYFIYHPNKYDGATIVKDLHHIKGLDINAMLHDYQYINYKVASSFKYKYYSDYIYAKQMEKQGRGFYAWIRLIGVTIGGLFYTPKSIIMRGFMSKEQKEKILLTYKLLT